MTVSNWRPILPKREQTCEPEILLPGQPDERRTYGATWTRMFVDEQGTPRIHVANIGPFGLLSFSLLLGIALVALPFLILSVLLVLLPLAGLLVAAGLIAGLLRGYTRRMD